MVRSGSIAAATPTPSVTTNWAGYAVATDLNSPQSGAVSDVSGTWVVPSVTGSSSRDTYSSVWVGIDGYATTSNTVEQIGTESDYSSGQPVYYAWYEMYPAYPVTLNMTIQPGDTIHAEVRYLDSAAGSDRFQLTLTDTPPTGRGAPATFTKALTITGDERSSAEWIVEAPSSGTRTLPLADFSAATITDASATLNGETGPIDAFGGISQIDMGSAYSTKAATSGLTDSAATPATSSFTVTYGPATSNPPTVTGVSPATGLAAGGTNVTITGTNLANADEVLFGSKAAQITGDNATQISVVTPAGSAGTVDVTVVTSGGVSAVSSADEFTYLAAPTVTRISPAAGSASGGTAVTITGANLADATEVLFGSNPGQITSDTATQIVAAAPAGTTGPVNVTVVTAGGASAVSSADKFAYVAAPTVTKITATAGPLAGGTKLTITGTNLAKATEVLFGDTAARITRESATRIAVVAPAGTAGTVDVTVVTAGGTSATSPADEFTYAAAPTITELSPATGPISAGTSVTITGMNLANATEVLFGANAGKSPATRARRSWSSLRRGPRGWST